MEIRPSHYTCNILFCFLSVFSSISSFAETAISLSEVWRITDYLDRPESVIYDTDNNVLYISNIGGEGTDKDNNGYISQFSPDGKIIKKKWAAGMHGPKGLAIFNDKLYTADIDALIEIDLATGKILARYPAEGATFLNDVAINNSGVVFVSDSWSSIIYQLKDSSLTQWLKDKTASNPNGLYAEEGYLLAAAGNAAISNKPGKARYLQKIAYDTKTIMPLHNTSPIGSVDAIENDNSGGYFLSDWPAGTVMHLSSVGEVTTLLTLGRGTADLDYLASEKMLYLPLMMDNQLVAYKVTFNDEPN